jgi:hypothetical protein
VFVLFPAIVVRPLLVVTFISSLLERLGRPGERGLLDS